MADVQLPAMWQGFEELEGYNQLDKSELVGKPFRIFEVMYRINKSEVEVCQLTAEFVDGEKFLFTDTSTAGVRQQIRDYLEIKDVVVTMGEIIPVSLVIRNGLRENVWETEVRGKTRTVKSYYLTASGRAAVETPPAKATRSK